MKARHIRISLVILIAVLGMTTFGASYSTILDKVGAYLCADQSVDIGVCAAYRHSAEAESPGSGTSTAEPATDANPTKAPWKAIMPDPVESGLRVYFLDVGQGDATLIRTPAGDHILIDGGNNDKGDEVVAYLSHLGVEQIDVMIATHPDADHIGGLDTVLEAFAVKAVYAPKVSHTTNTYKDFLTAVQQEKLKIKTAAAGVEIKLEGVEAVFVAPVKTYGNNLNEWSAVLRLTYQDTTFLFTGDAESASEQDMIESRAAMAADVLKVGHHGARTSSGRDFLAKVNPDYAVISAAAGNSYGHPTQDALNRLAEVGADVYRTDVQGTVTAVSDGKTITFATVRK